MKKLLLLMILCLAVPAFAVPTIQFSQDSSGTGPTATVGTWVFDASVDTLTFNQDIVVSLVLGGTTDPLAGAAYVHIPVFDVTGSAGSYTLTPVTTTIEVKDSSNVILFSGTLGVGTLTFDAGDASAGAYEIVMADITGITLGTNTLSSPIVQAFVDYGVADFNLSIQFGSALDVLLDGSIDGSDGFSGSMTIIPAPGAILLGGIGVTFVGWLRRRRTL